MFFFLSCTIKATQCINNPRISSLSSLPLIAFPPLRVGIKVSGPLKPLLCMGEWSKSRKLTVARRENTRANINDVFISKTEIEESDES